MNLIEVIRIIKPFQKVSSKKLGVSLIMGEDGEHLVELDKYEKPSFLTCPLKLSHLDTYDWEIEKVWTNFDTAWSMRKNQGKRIRSEFWHETVDLDMLIDTDHFHGLELRVIDGQWEVRD